MAEAHPPIDPLPRRKRPNMRAFVHNLGRRDLERTLGELRRSLPGAGISLLIHLLLLALMTWWVVPRFRDDPTMTEVGWSTIHDEQKAPVEVETVHIPKIAISESTASPTRTIPNPQPAPADEISFKPPVELADAQRALSLRQEQWESARGNDSNTAVSPRQKAINDALRWIVRQQQPSGAWSLSGPYPDGGSIETQTGATALALLALLGDGQSPSSGTHALAISNGLEWLIRNQHPDGDLFDSEELGKEPHFYAHSQATIALCEALALTGDDTYREPAERAVDFLVTAQNPKLGGWKYRKLTETGIGDLSVTGWALMALHAARSAKIDVPLETFLLADQFLDSVQLSERDGARYRYRPDAPAEESQHWSMTAEGLLCRQWLGWPKHTPALRRGVDFLLSEVNRPQWLPRRRNVYAWYYTAQTLHNIGGPDWEAWFTPTAEMIIRQQQSAGRDQGSWHPTRPPGAFQERSQDGGRLYLTVMCTLILETPTRHAPLYDFPAEN